MTIRSPKLIRAGEPAAFANHEINWGVRRRPGFSEFDDPSAHIGLTQHAFLYGTDAQALCGYRPHPWTRGRSVRVAAATHSNPPCDSCRAAIAMSSALVVVPVVPDPVREVFEWPTASLPAADADAAPADAVATVVKRRRRARATPVNT